MLFPVSPPERRQNARKRVRAAALAGGMLAGGIGLSLALAPFGHAGVAPAAPSEIASSATAAPDFSSLVKRVMPAVVNISATQKSDPGAAEQDDDDAPDQTPSPRHSPSPYDDFLRKFFDQHSDNGRDEPDFGPHPGAQHVALGSGFIIDPSGYIVTNNHVVAKAEKITVVFQDGTKHPAKIIGRDAKTDLALLKIRANEPLPYVSWGNSDALDVGDWVLAVGNPFGLGGTVSKGIVSARRRDIHSGPYDDFLQIDASINRGNSGGPTFSLDGKVVGINTAIYSPSGGSVGIGFAIPASLAKPVIDQLRDHGTVERSWLGVQIQPVTPEIAKSLGMSKPEGALVADVVADGPAAKAGVKQGDAILSFNGHAIADPHDLARIVAETPVAQTAVVKVWREGKEVDLEAKTVAMTEKNPRVGENQQHEIQPEKGGALGLELSALTDDLRQRLGVPQDVDGVAVTGVADHSPAAERGIETGDVIQSIDRQKVTSPQEAADKLKSLTSSRGASALLLLNRHGVSRYVALAKDDADGENAG
jgi:serine protease Do